MVTEKFNKDFSKGNKNISKIIEDIVADYFLKEKVTEDSLRQLKAHVAQAVGEYKKNSQSVKGSAKGSEVSQKELKEREKEADSRSNKGQREAKDQKKSEAGRSKASTSSRGTS